MRAMLLKSPGRPLELTDVPTPVPQDGQIVVRVECCAVCRTDLHVVDGELPDPKLPLIPGHQIVGRVEKGSGSLRVGDRVGIPWLGWTCGQCRYCQRGEENLCEKASFTGYTIDGGYADRVVADARYCFAIPENYTSEEAAPLLCAGLIGYRAYRMTGEAPRLGFYGFGSAAHILVQLANGEGRKVYAFTRGKEGQRFARDMGAAWAGGPDESQELDAAIIFAPAGELVVKALRNVARGGSVVCAGIHMSDIPSFPYSLLWNEHVIRSVANLTRRDGEEFFARASAARIETRRTLFPLARANEALAAHRQGTITGTAVLEVS